MIEKFKTVALIMLVALSLIQSYLLAYSMPGLVVTIRSDQDYVNPEPLGPTSSVEKVIFPETLVLHLGDNVHTILYPETQFYDMILKQRLVGREFKSFQRTPANSMDWEEIRKKDAGIELRFENGISVELLQKLLKIEGDILFLNEKIDRIWIYKTTDTEEVRTFFFSSDGKLVYESVRADLTVRDVQDYVGFGQYLTKYEMTSDGIYIPLEPIKAAEMVYPYEVYSPDQMQRSLFSDPSTTRAIEDRSGSQIYTDGKRGLQVKQNGMWITYTNPAATQSSANLMSDNVYSSIDFVNQHGGWDGVYRLVNPASSNEAKYVTFQQYVEQYPVISYSTFRYGYMQLTLQQGIVTEYDRSLITLGSMSESRRTRWLPGGDSLKQMLNDYVRRSEVKALFPALKALPSDYNKMKFIPVWAVRHADGTESILAEAYINGYEPRLEEPGDAEAEGVTDETGSGQAESGQQSEQDAQSNSGAVSRDRQQASADDPNGASESESSGASGDGQASNREPEGEREGAVEGNDEGVPGDGSGTGSNIGNDGDIDEGGTEPSRSGREPSADSPGGDGGTD